MEFWLPISEWDLGAIDELCRQHILPGRDRPLLQARSLRGMLMGYADLVCQHEGRYWVLDYKSNSLGSGPQNYEAPQLEQAILEHRYDVQALIYLHALDGLLRSRLGVAYQAEQHLGGALFVFLRGMDNSNRGCLVMQGALNALAALQQQYPSQREGRAA